MEAKNGIYVYPQNCTDFSDTGLVGKVVPMEAIFEEEKNGRSEITVRLSYDEYQRWRQFIKGNIIKCKVPVRIPPEIQDDEYSTTALEATFEA